ncbi:MAG: response regulator [bacterium]|nr:response regulator [bacterium]
MDRILVVDDEYVVRRLMEQALKSCGYTVCLADSAEVALELLATTRYVAAILDVNLPGASGIELHRKIWQRDRHLARRCLFISGAAQDHATHDYISTRAAGFLEKPFGAEELQGAVRRLLQNGGSS